MRVSRGDACVWEKLLRNLYTTFFHQEFPTDIILIVVWLVASIVASNLPLLDQTLAPVLFAIPVIIIIPGYCFVAALFPKNADLDLGERLALSVGFSLAIISLICGGFIVATGEILLGAVVLAVSLFTWVMILVTIYRRGKLPQEKRFSMPFSENAGKLRKGFFPDGGDTIDRLLTVCLILAILVAISSTILVIASPQEGERYTEFFILDENKMAQNYPDQVIPGQNYSLFIGVGNHEYRAMNYTIETWIVLTEFNNRTNSTAVVMMVPSNGCSSLFSTMRLLSFPILFLRIKTSIIVRSSCYSTSVSLEWR